MGAFVHLKRRASGMYVVRLIVPRWLRDAAGQREVHRTTGCRDLALAKVVAAEISARWHARINSLRHMDAEKLRRVSVELLGDGLIQLPHAANLLGAEPHGLARRLQGRHTRFFVEAAGWDGWLLQDLWDLDREIDELGRVVGILADDVSLNRTGQRSRVTETLSIWFDDEALAVALGSGPVLVRFFAIGNPGGAAFVAVEPGVPLTAANLWVRRSAVEALRSELSGALAAAAPRGAMEPTVVEAAATLDSIAKFKYRTQPLSVLTKNYLEARRHSWGRDELRKQTDACSALVELSGDPPLELVDRDLLCDVAKKLGLVPDRRDLVKRRLGDKNLGWTKLIEIAEREDLRRLSPGGVERLLEDITSVFVWGVDQGRLKENPAARLAGEVFRQMGGERTPQHMRRDAFSEEDLRRIFSAEWFARGVGRLTSKGIYFQYRPHYYWLPLLGLYAGGRINELAQLYLGDIRTTDDGVWYIDFNEDQPDKLSADEDDDTAEPDSLTPQSTGAPTVCAMADVGAKRLKTVNSIRAIPLHSRLQELGLLQYAEALRRAGHQRLFPELRWNEAKGYGKAASSWFDERFLGRDLRIERNGRKVFHSFRHNFETALERAAAQPKAIKQLMGHSLVLDPRGDSAPGYGKKRSAFELAPVIELLRPKLPPIANFKIEEALQAIQHALDLKGRQRSGRKA